MNQAHFDLKAAQKRLERLENRIQSIFPVISEGLSEIQNLSLNRMNSEAAKKAAELIEVLHEI